MKKGIIIFVSIILLLIVILVIFRKKIMSFLTEKETKKEDYEPSQRGILDEAFEGAKAGGVVFKSNVNNPMNIRANSANNWKGKTTENGAAFESFDTIHNGIRAGIKTLKTYFEKHGLTTVREIITRFAPPEDSNDTEDYINFVAIRMGATPDLKFEPSKEEFYTLVNAIAYMENNYNIKYSDYEKAWDSI